MKYNIGDRVSNFEIVGILKADFYHTMHMNTNFNTWDKLDKDWKSKLIYHIKLDESQKAFSIEDLQNAYPDRDYQEIVSLYESLPSYKYLTIPQAQLEQQNVI